MAEFDPSQPFEQVEFDPSQPFEAVGDSQPQAQASQPQEDKRTFWEKLLANVQAAGEKEQRRPYAQLAALTAGPLMGARKTIGKAGAAAVDKYFGSEKPFGELMDKAAPQINDYYEKLETEFPEDTMKYGLLGAAVSAPVGIGSSIAAKLAGGAGPVVSGLLHAGAGAIEGGALGALQGYGESSAYNDEGKAYDAKAGAVAGAAAGSIPGLTAAGLNAFRTAAKYQPLNRLYSMLGGKAENAAATRADDLAAQMADVTSSPAPAAQPRNPAPASSDVPVPHVRITSQPKPGEPGYADLDTGMMKMVDPEIDAMGKGDMPAKKSASIKVGKRSVEPGQIEREAKEADAIRLSKAQEEKRLFDEMQQFQKVAERKAYEAKLKKGHIFRGEGPQATDEAMKQRLVANGMSEEQALNLSNMNVKHKAHYKGPTGKAKERHLVKQPVTLEERNADLPPWEKPKTQAEWDQIDREQNLLMQEQAAAELDDAVQKSKQTGKDVVGSRAHALEAIGAPKGYRYEGELSRQYRMAKELDKTTLPVRQPAAAPDEGVADYLDLIGGKSKPMSIDDEIAAIRKADPEHRWTPEEAQRLWEPKRAKAMEDVAAAARGRFPGIENARPPTDGEVDLWAKALDRLKARGLIEEPAQGGTKVVIQKGSQVLNRALPGAKTKPAVPSAIKDSAMRKDAMEYLDLMTPPGESAMRRDALDHLDIMTPPSAPRRSYDPIDVPPDEVSNVLPMPSRPPPRDVPPIEMPSIGERRASARGPSMPGAGQAPIEIPGGWQRPQAPANELDPAAVAAGRAKAREIAQGIGSTVGAIGGYANGGMWGASGGIYVGKRAGASVFDFADKLAAKIPAMFSDPAKLTLAAQQGGKIGQAASFVLGGGKDGMSARALVVASQPWFREALKEHEKR